jgi:TatD DNase family protein
VNFVDAHFHLDLYKDPVKVLSDCETHEVYTIAVTNAPSVFAHTQKIAAHTKVILPALGLHPELVATHGHELPELLRLMDQTRFIGEVGLDYVTSDVELRKKQLKVFEMILKRSTEFGDKIITVHSRRAASDVIACVGSGFPGSVILHWFSGSKRELRAGLEAGCYFSVNPAMLRSERGRALILEIPLNRLLTETDGPFVEVNGARAVPSDVKRVIEDISKLMSIHPSVASAAVSTNFKQIINQSFECLH